MNPSPWNPQRPNPDTSMAGVEAEVLALRQEVNRLGAELATIKSMGPIQLLRWWWLRVSSK